MSPGDWIAIAFGTPTTLGSAGVLVAKLTRIAVAVEDATKAVAAVVTRVDDHERRLNKGGL